MSDEIKEGLWDAKQVAQFLRLKNEETVYRWAKRGLIPFVSFGRLLRFRPADVHALAENGLPAEEEIA